MPSPPDSGLEGEGTVWKFNRHGTFFRIFDVLATTAFIVMLISTTLQIVFRYLLHVPMMWTEELSRLLMVVVTYTGAAVAWAYGQHIRVDYLETRLPPVLREILNAVLGLIMAWFIWSLFLGSLEMIDNTWNLTAASMTWLKMAYVYMAVALGAVGLFVYIVADVVGCFVRLFGRKPPRSSTLSQEHGDAL